MLLILERTCRTPGLVVVVVVVGGGVEGGAAYVEDFTKRQPGGIVDFSKFPPVLRHSLLQRQTLCLASAFQLRQ